MYCMSNGVYSSFGAKSQFKWISTKINRYWGLWTNVVFSNKWISRSQKTMWGKYPPIEYYKKRIITILPLYYFCIIWYFITESLLNFANIITIPEDIYHLRWFRYFFLMNGIVDSNCYFWGNLGITWTIPVFVFFYLIAPLILKRITNYKIAIISWLIIWVLSHLINKIVFNPYNYKSSIVNNLHVFFFGILLFLILKNNKINVSCLILNIMLVPMIVTKHYSEMFLFLFSSITILCINLENSFITNKKIQVAISVFDEYSYSLYLMHDIVFCSFIDRINNLFPRWQIGVVAMIGTIIATWIGHNYIEIPLKMIFSKILKLSSYKNNI